MEQVILEYISKHEIPDMGWDHSEYRTTTTLVGANYFLNKDHNTNERIERAKDTCFAEVCFTIVDYNPIWDKWTMGFC